MLGVVAQQCSELLANNVGSCCTTMLGAVGQQCWELLHNNVWSCWPTMFGVEGVVSKETVVLRRWGSSIQKFGFINGVDNVNWPPYRDSKS